MFLRPLTATILILGIALAATVRAEFGEFANQYCLDCHSGEDAEGGARIDELQQSPPGRQNRKLWLTILRNLESHRMPPEDADQPSDDERQRMVAVIRAGLDIVDCTGTIDPGRVPMKRLTRYEYRRTVRDLLGIDYELTADFPADDVGYGFDNIGDVLTLSPLLFGKYVVAAEEIAARVVGPLPDSEPRHWNGVELVGGDFGSPLGDSYALTSQGSLTRRIYFQYPGRYRIRIIGEAQQAGPDRVRMGLEIDGRSIKVFKIAKPTGERFEYKRLVRFEAGETLVGVSFLNDYWNPDAVDDHERDRNLIIHRLVIEGPLPEPDWPTPQWRRVLAAGEAAGQSEPMSRDGQMRRIATHLASRAYRRPATSDEISELLGILDHASGTPSIESDLQHLVTAVLIAPQFLFRIEEDPAGDKSSIRELNSFEIATRLSYFLWSSMPDDALLQQAANDELRTPPQVLAAARRMLDDPKSDALIENFADQWLQLRRLDSLTKDRDRFPQFNHELAKSMRTETHLFVDSILREDRSVLDLLDADHTFVDARLAEHYGLNTTDSDGFQRVSLRNTSRGGILTQAAVLNITSLPTRTSPVLRGKWILDNLLLDPPPPALPDVPQLPEKSADTSGQTLRERLEQHRSNPQCSACHQRMDPLGFALESFDAVGVYRTDDDGEPLDLSASLPDGNTFNGVNELRTILRRDYADQFVRCLAEKLFTYALGRGTEDSDECTLRRIVDHTRSNGDRFSAMIDAIVTSDAFRKRR